MPRGRPKKVQPLAENTSTTVGVDVITSFETHVVEAVPAKEEKPVISEEQLRINESRKALLHPLQPGQRFFESPDGEIIVGEDTKDQVWSRRMNRGRGGWVNARR